MNNLKKKIISVVTVLTVVTMMMPMAPAMATISAGCRANLSTCTATELTEYIAELTATLNTLQVQLGQGGTGGTAVYAGVPAGFTFTKNLSQGMTDSDVVNLKIILAAEGCVTGLTNNSYFGSQTLAGVKCFQLKYKTQISALAGYTISASGFVGAGTRAQLNALLAGGVPVACTTNADCAAGKVCQTGVCVTAPAAAALTVALAAANPVAANLQKGTANNPVLTLTLTGSTAADTNVNTITITQFGNAADASVPTVRIFDENNIQLGTDRALIGGIANFVLVPALIVPKNGSRTITVTANILAGADTLTTVQFGVASASNIGTGVFTGSFPIKGNVFTVVPAGTLGTLTSSDYATPPVVSVKIGATNVVLESFIVSAGSREDISLNQMTITNAGTIADSDITNIRIRQVGGAVVAGPVNLSNSKATLNLTTPVLLAKGTSQKFEVVADVVNGNTRNIAISLAAGSILGIGQTSGVNLVNTGATTATTITVGYGQLVVAQSVSHPSGTGAAFIKTVNQKTLAVFSVRAVGETVVVNTIDLKFNGTSPDISGSSYLSSVGLYDGDTLISDLKDTIIVETATQFTLNWTIPADTVKNLNVKAVTTHLVPSTAETLAVTWDASTGYGLSSGLAVNTTTDVLLTAVTVYPTGTFSLAMDTLQTPYNQGIIEPSANVFLGAIKVRSTREDMKLSTMTLVTDVSSATSVAVASLTLYDSDGVTALSYPQTVADPAGTFTFAAGTNLLQDVVFQKDAYKTVYVKGNPITTASDYFLKFAAAGMTLTGLDSAADATNSAAVVLGTSAQGKFTFAANVLGIRKNAASPSGTVARGSIQPYAIWDVFNPTSGDLNITSIAFTSLSGLPTNATETMFRIVDENDTALASRATTTVVSTGVVTFDATVLTGGVITIPAASSKSIKLEVNTTNSASGYWVLGTQMQWSVYAAAHVSVSGTGGTVGYDGTAFSIPATANVVTLP